MTAKYIESRNNKRIRCTNALFSERMLIEIDNSVTHIFIDEGQWVNKDRPGYAKSLSDKGMLFMYRYWIGIIQAGNLISTKNG